MQALSEPEIGYVYKVAGSLATLAFLAAGLVSVFWRSFLPIPADFLFLASALAGAVLFTGLASSEAWFLSMRRRYMYSTTLERYSAWRLVLFVAGISGVTIVAVLLLLR
jgi:hypothetical protein